MPARFKMDAALSQHSNRALMMTSQHDRSVHAQELNARSSLSGVPRLQLINICKSYNSLKANDQ